MKKLIVGLLAAFAMTAGLVSFAGASQAAPACTATKYTPCVATHTSASYPKKAKRNSVEKLKVKAGSGNAFPFGRYQIKVKGPQGKVRTYSRAAKRSAETFDVKTFGKGTYTFKVKFIPYKKSTLYKSTSSGKFTV